MRGETDTMCATACRRIPRHVVILITEDYSTVHWLVSEDVKDSVDCIAGSTPK